MRASHRVLNECEWVNESDETKIAHRVQTNTEKSD